jgi:hypothetical protein
VADDLYTPVTAAGNWDPTTGWGFQLQQPLSNLAGGQQPIADALGAGRDLAREFYDFGTMGRVNEAAPSFAGDPKINDQGETLARYRAESFIGGQRPEEATQSLGYLNNAYGQANSFSPELSQLRQSYMANQSYARPGEIQGGLDMMRQQAMTAGQRDPNTQALINQRMSMTGGMTPAQETAIREQGVNSLNQGMATAMRGLRNQYSGATGPAAMKAALPITGQYQDARANLERGLVADKMNYQQQALAGAENLVSNTNANEFGRQYQANTGYMGALQPQSQFEYGANRQGLNEAGEFVSSTDQNRFANTLGAGSTYENALYNRNQAEIADRQGRLNNFAGYQNTLANQTLARQQYNLDQLAQEKAGQLGLVFGAGQFGAANQAAREATAVAREGIASASA